MAQTTIDFRDLRPGATADEAIPYEMTDGWQALADAAREYLRAQRDAANGTEAQA